MIWVEDQCRRVSGSQLRTIQGVISSIAASQSIQVPTSLVDVLAESTLLALHFLCLAVPLAPPHQPRRVTSQPRRVARSALHRPLHSHQPLRLLSLSDSLWPNHPQSSLPGLPRTAARPCMRPFLTTSTPQKGLTQGGSNDPITLWPVVSLPSTISNGLSYVQLMATQDAFLRTYAGIVTPSLRL